MDRTRAYFSRERFENPEQYAGYSVLDPERSRIGTARELFVNEHGELEYIRVKAGFMARGSFLLPVEMVAVDDERQTIQLS